MWQFSQRAGQPDLKSDRAKSVCVRALLSLFLGLSFLSFASVSYSEGVPRELQGVGVDEHLGSSIDLNLKFQDESGATVPLQKYFDGTKPVLFFLVYYECPNLCTFVLNATVDSIKKMDLTSGKNFEVVAVSIDPRENSALASVKKQAYLNLYGRPEGAAGWHFLVGKQPEITALANQIGFKYKWDNEQKQFAHTSAMFVLTGEGRISRYFYGIDYPTRDLKVAMLEASRGKIGNIVDKILLFCYHYDSSTKKYVLLASRIMTAGGAATLLVMGLLFGLGWRRENTSDA